MMPSIAVESPKKNLYAIVAAYFLAIVGFGAISPIIPFYVQELGVTDPAKVKMWVGAILTSGPAMYAVVAPFWGRLADIYGRRIMLIRAYFADMVMMVLSGLAAHPGQIVVFRLLAGLFTGTATASTVLVATTTPPKESGFSLGLLQSAGFVGGALGPLVGGLIADNAGYRITFLTAAALQLLAALISVFVVKEDFKRKPSAGGFWQNFFPDVKWLIRSRELMILILIVGAFQTSLGLISPILPLFIQSLSTNMTRLGTTTGLVLGLRAAVAALAAVILGRTGDKIGHKRLLILCLAGGALTHLPLVWIRTTTQLLILRVAGGAFIGGTMPALNTLIARKSDPRQQGTVYGIRGTIAAGGMAIGPILGAGIATIGGYASVFIVISILLAGITGLVSAGVNGSRASSDEFPKA